MVAKLSMICSKQDNGSYFAICPEIKGCFTQGDTYEEATANLKELVEITVKEELDCAADNRIPIDHGTIAIVPYSGSYPHSCCFAESPMTHDVIKEIINSTK